MKTIQQQILEAINEEDLEALDSIYRSGIARVDEPIRYSFSFVHPLVLAVQNKCFKAAKFLFDNYVTKLPRPTSAYPRIVFDVIEINDKECLQFLDEELHINIHIQGAIHYSLNDGYFNSAYYLIKHHNSKEELTDADNDGNTPLHLAAEENCYIFEHLMRYLDDSNLYITNKAGLTPIDVAVAADNHTALLFMFANHNVDLDGRDYGVDTNRTIVVINSMSTRYSKLMRCENAPWYAKCDFTKLLTGHPIYQFPDIDEDDSFMLHFAPDEYFNQMDPNRTTNFNDEEYEKRFS